MHMIIFEAEKAFENNPTPIHYKFFQQTKKIGELEQLDKEHQQKNLRLLNGEKLDSFP